jgi:sulfatase modifying factor 1
MSKRPSPIEPQSAACHRQWLGLLSILGAVGVAGSGCDPDPVITVAYARPLDVAEPSPSIEIRLPPKVPACPEEMAHVGSACVDRYEAHLVLADTPEVVHPPYERPAAGVRYLARSSGGVMPQAYISRDEAEAACRGAGKRLCTGREWRRACGGRAHTLYPYGAEEVPGRCNSGKPHLPSMLFGVSSTTVNGEAVYNSPRLDQEPGFLAKTGEYTGCVNDFGLFDMAGNLHEWVSDRAGRRRPRAVFMGGFFSSTPDHGPGCQHVSKRHSPAYHDYSTGFRCCRDETRAAGGDATGRAQ